MSAVCTCYDPAVVRQPGKEPFCSRCGHWWMPQYGSMAEGIPTVNLALRRSEQAALNRTQKIGRNEACYCGSGKKFKKCHGGPKP